MEKAKRLISRDADLNYQNECEQQMTKTQQLSLHFLNKGTKLRDLLRREKCKQKSLTEIMSKTFILMKYLISDI